MYCFATDKRLHCQTQLGDTQTSVVAILLIRSPWHPTQTVILWYKYLLWSKAIVEINIFLARVYKDFKPCSIRLTCYLHEHYFSNSVTLVATICCRARQYDHVSAAALRSFSVRALAYRRTCKSCATMPHILGDSVHVKCFGVLMAILRRVGFGRFEWG